MDTHLESVLDAYAASEPGPNRATVVEWIREYPQFARELIEFTARWQLLKWADESSGDTPEEVVTDDDRLLLRAMSAAQGAFYTARANREAAKAQDHADATNVTVNASSSWYADRAAPSPGMADTPIASLARAARRAGFEEDNFVTRLGLSDGLFRKLDRRLIDPVTIPTRVLHELASAFGLNVRVVAAYTHLTPTFGISAQHRSDQAPSLPARQEDFFDAVRKDLTIDESRRQYLLLLPRPELARGAKSGSEEV